MHKVSTRRWMFGEDLAIGRPIMLCALYMRAQLEYALQPGSLEGERGCVPYLGMYPGERGWVGYARRVGDKPDRRDAAPRPTRCR